MPSFTLIAIHNITFWIWHLVGCADGTKLLSLFSLDRIIHLEPLLPDCSNHLVVHFKAKAAMRYHDRQRGVVLFDEHPP